MIYGALQRGWHHLGRLDAALGGAPTDERDGTGRAVATWFALALLVPAATAALHHHVFGNVVLAFGGAVLTVGALLVLTLPVLNAWTPVEARPIRTVLGYAAVAGLLVFAALHATSAPAFNGVPSHSSGDLGTHHMFYRQMVEDGARPYHGMVAPYVLLYAQIAVLGGDWLDALRRLHAWTWLGLGIGVVVIVAQLRAGLPRMRREVATAVSLVGVGLAAATVAIPLLVYYQQEGYLGQVAGVAPLVIGIAAYATARRRLVRLGVLWLLVPVIRFTYGLNLGDVVLVVALGTARESLTPEIGARAKTVLRRLAVAIGVAAVLVYIPIYDRHVIPGGFVATPLEPQAIGLFAIAGATVALAWVGRRVEAEIPAALARASFMVGWLCLIPATILGLWLVAGLPVDYYLRKYTFAAMVVGSILIAPITVGTAVTLMRGPRPRWVAGVVVLAHAMAAGGVVQLAEAARPYQPLAAERSPSAEPPLAGFGSFAEPDVTRFIAATLAANPSYRFGGFLTNRWPESQYTNAVWPTDATHLREQFVTHGAGLKGMHRGTPPVMAPGFCVFAYDPLAPLPRGPNAWWPPGGRATATTIALAPDRACAPVRVVGQPAVASRVCARCYGGEQRRLLPFGKSPSFHGIEHAPQDPAVMWRWTKGNGAVAYQTSRYDAGRTCELVVHTPGDRAFEIEFDQHRLGPGPRQTIAPQPRGSTHVIRVRSPTFAPADVEPNSTDTRRLGVMVSEIELRCGPQ